MHTDRACALDHGNHPTPSMPGIDLCQGHREDLQQDLNDTDLLLRLITDMALPTRGDGNRRGRPIDAQAPANLSAIAATDWRTTPDNGDQLVSATATINRWAATIWAHTPLETPTHPTIDWGLALITDHINTLCRQPHVVRFAQDLHDTAHMLRNCAGEILPPIGRHKAPHPHHPERDCGGRLYPTTGQFGVTCIDCGETYNGHLELRRLGLVLENQ